MSTTRQRARHIAIRCLEVCFSSEAAGGFESADNAGEDWVESEIEIHSLASTGFTMRIDGHDIQIYAKP